MIARVQFAMHRGAQGWDENSVVGAVREPLLPSVGYFYFRGQIL